MAKSAFVLPNAPAFAGLRFFQQAMVLDPLAGNAIGAVLSDAIAVRPGD